MSYPLCRISTTTPVREFTPDLWRGVQEVFADGAPSLIGNLRFDDFKTPATNITDASAVLGWFIQDAAAGGTNENFTSVAGNPDGVMTLSATTGTDWFGIEAHRGDSTTTLGDVVLPTHPTAARGTVIFEAYVDFDASDHWFIGLTEAIVEFLSATGALPTNSDYIGFFRSDAGALTFVCANDNNGGTAVTDSATLIAIASVPTGLTKVGFRVNNDNSVEIFVDDVRYKTAGDGIDPLALPIENLTPKLATLRGATGDLATVTILPDWVATWVES